MKTKTICRSCDGVIRFTRVQPKKLKAIEDTTLDLDDRAVIIGAKGLGKGSVLQSLHWMLPSATHPRVRPREEGGRTVSEHDALQMPTREYRNAGHRPEYGNKVGSPQLEVTLSCVADGVEVSVSM